jgi:hypothetical protein
MLSAIRRRLRVSPATAVAGLALVFAMTGGAYAAKKYLITSTKQISPSVLKQLQGKAGAAGTPGAAGTQGAQGPAGPAGPPGPSGGKGETGAAGKDGLQGKQGSTGATGPAGSPWTVGGLLPSKKTETGSWGGLKEAAGTFLTPISFTLPLETAPELVIVTGTEVAGKCPGVQSGIPTAEPGKLCVYKQGITGGSFASEDFNPSEAALGAGPTGVILAIECSEFCFAYGSWAVTAK